MNAELCGVCAAVPMARNSNLSARLYALVDEQRNRSPIHFVQVVRAAVSVLCVSCIFASLSCAEGATDGQSVVSSLRNLDSIYARPVRLSSEILIDLPGILREGGIKVHTLDEPNADMPILELNLTGYRRHHPDFRVDGYVLQLREPVLANRTNGGQTISAVTWQIQRFFAPGDGDDQKARMIERNIELFFIREYRLSNPLNPLEDGEAILEEVLEELRRIKSRAEARAAKGL